MSTVSKSLVFMYDQFKKNGGKIRPECKIKIPGSDIAPLLELFYKETEGAQNVKELIDAVSNMPPRIQKLLASLTLVPMGTYLKESQVDSGYFNASVPPMLLAHKIYGSKPYSSWDLETIADSNQYAKITLILNNTLTGCKASLNKEGKFTIIRNSNMLSPLQMFGKDPKDYNDPRWTKFIQKVFIEQKGNKGKTLRHYQLNKDSINNALQYACAEDPANEDTYIKVAAAQNTVDGTVRKMINELWIYHTKKSPHMVSDFFTFNTPTRNDIYVERGDEDEGEVLDI